MVTRLEIKPEVLQYYVDSSTKPMEVLQEKVKNFDKYINGEKQPTFNQLSSIAKVLNVPTGLLILPNVVESPSNRLSFRTLNSENLEGMSNELKDTIAEMEIKQDFLKEEISEPIPFLGMFTIEDDYQKVIETIRDYLGIDTEYYKETGREPIKYFREKINQLGIFVFFNGKIKDNTQRPLNLKEFRGFVLSDSKAPIIFINQLDSKAGQLFTLIHELVHLFLGIDDIYNVIEIEHNRFDPTETFVNKVTAEILVPAAQIPKQVTVYEIESFANKFKVSEFVIARRFFDLKRISKKQYTETVQQLEAQFKELSKIKTGNGGNYHHNINFRIDRVFFNYVDNALKQNKITYTEAFKVLGIGFKGYKSLERRRN